MAIVFVHGVPDTHLVWNQVLERLDRADAKTVQLPGFGAPIPEGFTATKEEYVNWLALRLRELSGGGPLDLVGHDWGSLLVVRVASVYPDLVRSWTGGAAPVSGEYVWHPAAQTWQAPGAGEAAMAALDEAVAFRMLCGYGVPPEQAAVTARHIDPLMKDCILRLYRSARNVFREWEPDLARIRAPGLVLWGENDPFAAPHFADRMGEQTSASRVVRLADCGHWWQCQRPDETAYELQRHWRETESGST